MRSADPLLLNSRIAPPTAFATPAGLGRIDENEPPSGRDSKLVVPVGECYCWCLHLLIPCCGLSDRNTGSTCGRIRMCAQDHAGKRAHQADALDLPNPRSASTTCTPRSEAHV